MMAELNDPDLWRARAEEARALATQMRGQPRDIMLSIAEGYDRIAILVGRRHPWEQSPSWWRMRSS